MGEQQVEPQFDGSGSILEISDEDESRAGLQATNHEEKEKQEATSELEKPAVVTLPAPRIDGRAPSWAKVPAGLKIPRGAVAYFILFRAEWTSTPHKGDRQAIVWCNTLADDLIAVERAKIHESQTRLNHELAKQMIRAVDGYRVNWDGLPGPGSIDVWWREIGPKCRSQLTRLWLQLHSFSQEEQTDFFEHCIASVATG